MQNRPAPAKVGRGAQLKGPTPFVTTDARPPPVGRAVNMQKGWQGLALASDLVPTKVVITTDCENVARNM
jgi:hypothetical protein